MPLFICFCPDYPNNLKARLKVREEHLAMGKKDREAGTTVFGRAFVDPESGDMVGSSLIYRYKTIEEAWARIKADPYWTGNVWDKEKAEVRQFADGPTDGTLKVQ